MNPQLKYRSILTAILAFAVLSACHSATPSGEPESSELSGFLLTTADSNWRFAWNNRTILDPVFSKARTVIVGEEVSTLIFFANPTTDKNGIAVVICDIRVIRPDSTIYLEENGAECYRGPIVGSAANPRLGNSLVTLRADKLDPIGSWTYEVRLTDQVSGTSIDLVTKVELLP